MNTDMDKIKSTLEIVRERNKAKLLRVVKISGSILVGIILVAMLFI